jgi:predicted nucleotidyltransferase
MFTKTQAKIMKVFASKITGRFSIKQVSEILKKPYPLIHRSIKALIEQSFLVKDEKEFISLNYKKNHSEIAYIESERAKEKIRNKSLLLFINDLNEKIGEDFFVLLIFGSFIEKDNPRDIDILIILDSKERVNQTEKIANNIASNFSLKLDINIISKESAYEMLSKRDNKNIINETLNKHLILFGGENYYRILKNAR